MENKYNHLDMEKKPSDFWDKPHTDDPKFHHNHDHGMHNPIDDLWNRINEESITRYNEDKKLSGILHALYHKIDDFKNVDIRELSLRLDNAIKRIPDMENVVTEGKLRDALSKYYNKYEISAAFSTSPIKDVDIKAKAYEKLNKYFTVNKKNN